MKTLGIETISRWIIYKNLLVSLVIAISTKDEPLHCAFTLMLIINNNR
jgi:hypothetical protein